MKNVQIRRVLIVVTSVIVLACSFAAVTRAMWSTNGTWVRTRQDDELIVVAMASKDPTTGVVYLAKDASNLDALVQKVRDLGGSVPHIDRRLEYVRAIVPTARIREALNVPAGNVAAVDLDLSFHNPIPFRPDGHSFNPPPPNMARIQAEVDSPATRAFMRASSPILHDLGADVWRRQHPTFDGRGVVVADVEELTDPLAPELSGALSLSGKPIRKIQSYHILADPGDHSDRRHFYDFANQWVDMHTRVSGSGNVTFNGTSYRLPHAGDFRIGLFDFKTAALASFWIDPEILEPQIGTGIFAVLWQPSTGLVWVDMKHSHDFGQTRAMRDFNRSGDWSYFGAMHSTRYPLLTPAVSFGVLEDPQRNTVAIALGQGVHALGVTTSAVGRTVGPNDPVHGIAPAAQIASFEYAAYKLHSQAEALIAAFEEPKVDVVVYEWASSLHTTVESGWFMGALGERLVTTFDKPLFVPGDNQPELVAIDDAGLGPDVIAVTGWQSAASYGRYEGFRPSTNVHKHWGGLTDGPAQDGALKPDLAAPSGYVAAQQAFTWDPADDVKPGLFTLPSRYEQFGGTSQATPTAGGATALLISAGKQEGIHFHATALAKALRAGAQPSSALAAHEQGNGLINVAATWRLLQDPSYQAAIRTSARVCGGSVRTTRWPNGSPNGGAGILETSGWHPGDAGTRTMQFCFARTVPAHLGASVLLNDGTYALAGLNVSGNRVAVTIHAHPEVAGIHSALVQLHDALGHQVGRGMITIEAATPLRQGNHYTLHQDVLIPRPGYTATFVDVPKGTDALIVQTNRDIPFAVAVQDPNGDYYDHSPESIATHNSFTIPQPTSGTWTILLVDTHDVSNSTHAILPVEPSVVHVTAQAVRVDRTALDAVASIFANVPVHEVGSVQSLLTKSGQFPSIDPILIPIQVPEDTDALMVDLTGSDSWVDAYVLDCRLGATCAPYARALGGVSDKRITIPNVKPGRYYLALDDYDPVSPRTGLPNYKVSVLTYNHLGTQTTSATGHAYEVNCDSPGSDIVASPTCGLFITTR